MNGLITYRSNIQKTTVTMVVFIRLINIFLLFICHCLIPARSQQRQYHPVGNFTPTTYSAGANSLQSIYLNFGTNSQLSHQLNGVIPSPGHVQQRTIYYPCLSRCPQYRWTYRWGSPNGPQQPLQPIQPQSPSPPQPVQPQQPNIHGALIRFVFPSQPNPFQTTPPHILGTSQSTASSSPRTTTVEVTSSTERTTTTVYELPTPPPYTQNGPGVPDIIVRPNPCPQGQPLMNEFHNPMTCNFVVKPNGGCPEKYWCHTGSSYETTTCCPWTGVNKDHCKLPKSNGEGEDQLIPRWYFDNLAHKCKRFLYKGMRGNANNFVTAMSCAEACETAEQATAIRNPCANGQPARDLGGNEFKCGVSDSRCPAGYYCHLGELAQANVCCELSVAASDRCNLAIRQGEGSAHLTRFYFNTFARKCVEFVYRGTKGNENSFLTLDECKSTCEKLPNPCPMLFDFGERKECLGEEHRCGKGEWCHLGSSRETTACCPAAAIDPCKLPLDLGQGIENIGRWYSIPSDDPCSRECRPFLYRGVKGNQNNFQSKTECEATCKADCPIALNPCADEEILLDPEGRPQRCNVTGQCPSDYWCHIGANPETTVCCSGVTKACDQPLAEGFGNALLSRWYYNARKGNCQKFIYRGIGGNQNNYVDYEECMNACPDSADNQQITTTTISTTSPRTTPTTTTSLPLPSANPCGSGKPLQATDGRSTFVCSPERLCPETHFCHISDDPALSHQCCLKNGDPCEQAPAVGEGDALLERFYFDLSKRRCRPFLYKGSRGNANNFLSSTDCEYVCIASLRQNPCPHGQPLADNTGEPLVCGGNNEPEKNPFASSGCPNGYWCHVGTSPETTNCCPQAAHGGKRPCELPLELGNGPERLDRWYFDSSAQACRRFWYTGLKGNANNFLSREQCHQNCLQLLISLAQQQGQSATEQTTVPAENFCLRGEPLLDSNENVLKCGEETFECPTQTHYCHTGHNTGNTGCCPKTGDDRCLVPLNRGLGKAASQIRWHFNSASRRCEAFDYAGFKGNENNFMTKRHCEEHCLKKVEAKQFCPHGEPKWEGERKSLVPTVCGPDKECPGGYVCHLSIEAGTTICCQDPAHFCLQARETGPCTENLVRFGYNSLTDTCVSYKFGGCDGTLNQFETLERCTEICCRQYKNRR